MMQDPSRNGPDPQKVEKVAKLLLDTFPNISPAVANLQAQCLTQAPEWSLHLHHNGAKDRDELIKLQKSLQKIELSIASLSPWTRNALEMLLHQATISQPPIPEFVTQSKIDFPRPPVTEEELFVVIDAWKSAAEDAEELLLKGRSSHGKNYRAVALIDDARRIWKANKGKTPPPRELNEDTHFARFLEKLFNEVGVGGGVERAYDAWFDVATDPNSVLDPPDTL